MPSNPNSGLVFDFPDPTPRFDFHESPSGSGSLGGGGSKSKSGGGNKRFGKFSKSKAGSGGGEGSSSNGSLGAGGSSGSFGSHGGRGTSLSPPPPPSQSPSPSSRSRDRSPSLSRNHSGDKAAGPARRVGPNAHGSHSVAGGSIGSGSTPHFDMPPSPPKTIGHRRAPSAANSSIGQVSEASEFSFDRVTVATNETGATGRSSNVSWNFLDQGTLNAVGAGQSFVPYTGDGGGNGSKVVSASAKTAIRGNNKASNHHRPNHSIDTFDMSVSDCEMDQIPMSGVASGGGGSVVSEISERTGGHARTGSFGRASASGGSGGAVKALLKEGMERVRNEGDGRAQAAVVVTPERVARDRVQDLSMIKEEGGSNKPGGDKPSPSRETHTTAKSTASFASQKRGFVRDLQENYATFKTERNGVKKEKGSALQSILEDVQFCGLYFCGMDTTVAGEEQTKYEAEVKEKKAERKREADDTFLGKVIDVGRGIPGCGQVCAVVEL
ncbi:hypothetical protein ACHAWF_004470 [Thalassiosira exigua]